MQWPLTVTKSSVKSGCVFVFVVVVVAAAAAVVSYYHYLLYYHLL